MRTILLIGGTKFIGALLIDSFIKDGASVYVFSRSAPRHETVTYIQGDRNNPADLEKLSSLISQVKFDCVYDMCCYEPSQVEPLFSKVASNTQRLVFFSSAAVYAKSNFYPATEDFALGENPSFGNYGTNKAEAEGVYTALTGKHGLQLTIFRPHYILGEGDYFNRHQYFYSRIENDRIIPIPGNGQAIIQFAYGPEVADLFYKVPFTQNIPLEILNVASNEMITLDGLAETFASSANRRTVIKHIDYRAAGLKEESFYDEYFPFPNLNLILDSSRAQRLYGYKSSAVAAYVDTLYKDWCSRKSQYKQMLSKFDERVK